MTLRLSFPIFPIIITVILVACSQENNIPVIEIPDTNLTETTYNILIDAADLQGKVSPYLMGFGTIYSFEKDSWWSNGTGKMPKLLKEFHTGILRYPGGAVVNRYHWNNLNGQGWQDNWNPNYDVSNDKSAAEFMSVDEYMENVTALGAEPMLGINMGSGLKYNRIQDGIDEAVALVQYCQDKGYEVKYWYLDNEAYHKGANYRMTAREYAEQINLYVPALKAVNPNIEIIINWESKIRNKNEGLKSIVSIAGSNIDIIEVHWYWSWQNSTFDHWYSSFPMNTKNEWYDGLSFTEEINAFEPLMKSLGHGHIKLASNEWNIAPGPDEAQTPSKFESALMISEQFSQYIDGGLFMACFWGLYWPHAEGNSVNRLILDPSHNYNENATATMFRMFADAMGGTKVKCGSTLKGAYDIAVLNQVNDELIIYVINKKQSGETLSTGIDIKNYPLGSVTATSFTSGSDQNGELSSLLTSIENENRLIIDLPKNSLTKIVIKK